MSICSWYCNQETQKKEVNEEDGESGAIGRVQEVKGSQQICFTFPNVKPLDTNRNGVKSLGICAAHRAFSLRLVLF